jgi:hypothetical protein
MRRPFARSASHPGAARLGRRALLLWIAYQSIKGTLTTVFIWAPLAGWYFLG